MGLNLHDLGFGKGFLDMILKARATKEKTDELDFVTLKTSVH